MTLFVGEHDNLDLALSVPSFGGGGGVNTDVDFVLRANAKSFGTGGGEHGSEYNGDAPANFFGECDCEDISNGERFDEVKDKGFVILSSTGTCM